MTKQLEDAIERGWDKRESVSPATTGELREAVETALAMLDNGEARVAEKTAQGWLVRQWLKKAVLLSFRLNDMQLIEGSNGGGHWWDKVPSKFADWTEEEFRATGFRAVPGSIVRRGAFVGRDAVLMPSFVNIGAHVGAGTMIDTWASVGSCAQVGEHCHISAGAGIGGVLEPLQANPTIIEDNCFIGARSEVVEGVIVEEGAVLGMGVFITASTKIIDRFTGETFRGRVPAYSVVVPGSTANRETVDGGPAPGLYCAVIIKRVDEKTRAKTSVNELLRG